MPRKPKFPTAQEGVSDTAQTADLGSTEVVESDQVELSPEVLVNTTVFRWNFDEIKARLEEGIKKYVGLAVSDENLQDMEKTAREISSLRTKVNRFRLETKKTLEQPASQFDAEAKELLEIISAAETPLKEQLEKYEQARVVSREKELGQFAWKTAVALGITDANFNSRWSVSSKLTQRGTTDKAAREQIVAEMEALLKWQVDDLAAKVEALRLAEEKTRREQTWASMVAMQCKYASQAAGLQTAVKFEDIKHLITSDTDPELINEAIDHAVRRQKSVEDAARALTAAVQNVAQKVADEIDSKDGEKMFGGPPPIPPAPVAVPSGPPPSGPPPTRQEKLWDVTLKFRCTNLQAAQLKPLFAGIGLSYETVSCTEAKADGS